MDATPPRVKIRAQILLGDEIAMGPGKAELLAAIASAGSISAAARAIGLSYRRAWLLVDTMNRCWRTPLVLTTVGGKRGATLSAFGVEVLARYRAMEAELAAVTEGEVARALMGDLAPTRG